MWAALKRMLYLLLFIFGQQTENICFIMNLINVFHFRPEKFPAHLNELLATFHLIFLDNLKNKELQFLK